MSNKSYIHPTSIIEENVKLGENCQIWHYSHLRSGVTLEGENTLGKGVYLDLDVNISYGTRIQNGVSIYKGVEIEKWCFIGPHVVFTNDSNPRAGVVHWTLEKTLLKTGCSIGAGSIIKSGIEIGAFSLIGVGSIVLKSIPDFVVAFGNPAVATANTCICAESRFALENNSYEKIQPCCSKKLKPGFLEHASNYLSKQ